jgi:hypothetical protein
MNQGRQQHIASAARKPVPGGPPIFPNPNPALLYFIREQQGAADDFTQSTEENTIIQLL